MNRRVKKRCNGPNRHENEFALEDLRRETPVAKDAGGRGGHHIDWPEEVVMRCRFCTEGRVVFTGAELGRISA